MFYDAIESGLRVRETSLSHDSALKIIYGGLVKFLCDFRYGEDILLCEKDLFCIAKATNALQGDEKNRFTALLGLMAAMDPYSRDSSYITEKIQETLCIDPELLEHAVEMVRKGIW